MSRGILFKVGFCLLSLSIVFYRHVEEQNQITALKIALPEAIKQLKKLREETTHLRYEIERFESSEHLLELAALSEYSHLKYPLAKEILAMSEGIPLEQESRDRSSGPKTGTPSITLASSTIKQ